MKKLKRLVSLALAGVLALLLLTACGGGGNAGGAGPARTGDELVDATNQCNYAFRTELTGGKGPDYLTANEALNRAAKEIFTSTQKENEPASNTLERIAYAEDVDWNELLQPYGLSTSNTMFTTSSHCTDVEDAGRDLYMKLAALYSRNFKVSSIGSYKVPYGDGTCGYLILISYIDNNKSNNN